MEGAGICDFADYCFFSTFLLIGILKNKNARFFPKPKVV
jgi:hypothetical protein